MDTGWDKSAEAWIRAQGDEGDWSRKHVLDRVMLERVSRRDFKAALDVGCGEGRFSRLLRQRGISTIGIDASPRLIDEAWARDADGFRTRLKARAFYLKPVDGEPALVLQADLPASSLVLQRAVAERVASRTDAAHAQGGRGDLLGLTRLEVWRDRSQLKNGVDVGFFE